MHQALSEEEGLLLCHLWQSKGKHIDYIITSYSLLTERCAMQLEWAMILIIIYTIEAFFLKYNLFIVKNKKILLLVISHYKKRCRINIVAFKSWRHGFLYRLILHYFCALSWLIFTHVNYNLRFYHILALNLLFLGDTNRMIAEVNSNYVYSS